MLYSIQIGETGIKKLLKRIGPLRAITEYIWNGFDANATTINITLKAQAGIFKK